MRSLVLLIAALLVFSAGPVLAAKNVKPVAMRPPQVQAGVSPTEIVQGFYRTLTSIMKEGPQLGFSGRYEKLQSAIDRAFNMEDMMRVSYGTSWVKTSPEEKQKLVEAFRIFSISNYASQFKEHNGEVFDVKGEKKGPRDGEMIVETTLASGNEKNELNYLMRKGAQGWQIVDVFVNGAISEMATRRSEFSGVVRGGGAGALIDLLQKKNQQLSQSS